MDLSNEVILKDIAGFENRIAAARVKLEALPSGQPVSYKERKKQQAKRKACEGEITHVNNLISIARSALNPSEGQPGQP